MSKLQATPEQLAQKVKLRFYEGSYQFHTDYAELDNSSLIAVTLRNQYKHRATTEDLWCVEILPSGQENRYQLTPSDMAVTKYMTIDAPRQVVCEVDADPSIVAEIAADANEFVLGGDRVEVEGNKLTLHSDREVLSEITQQSALLFYCQGYSCKITPTDIKL